MIENGGYLWNKTQGIIAPACTGCTSNWCHTGKQCNRHRTLHPPCIAYRHKVTAAVLSMDAEQQTVNHNCSLQCLACDLPEVTLRLLFTEGFGLLQYHSSCMQ